MVLTDKGTFHSPRSGLYHLAQPREMNLGKSEW